MHDYHKVVLNKYIKIKDKIDSNRTKMLTVEVYKNKRHHIS